MDWLDDSDNGTTETYAWVGRSGLCWLALAVGDPEDPAPDGSTDFRSSTDGVDRYGDIVEQGQWRLANYRKNPVVLLEHGFGPEGRLVIGRSDRVGIVKSTDDKHELRNRVRWDAGDHNPMATLVAAQHRTGFRNAVSVGFKPGEAINRTKLDKSDPRYVDGDKVPAWKAGYVFRFPELYELSSVAVPGNADALSLSADLRNAEDVDAKIRSTLAELLPSMQRDALLSFIRRDEEVRRAMVIATLAGMPAEKPNNPAPASQKLRWYEDPR